jgi:hypothetical protein
MVSTNSIFVVPDGADKYVIKFVYEIVSKGTTDDPLLTLSRHIFNRNGKLRSLAGQSIVTDRGNKNIDGSMGVIGSRNAYGQACQGLGPGVKQVRAYNPNDTRDEIAIELYLDHADQLSRDENRLTPACGGARGRLMMDFDPNGNHRINNICTATAISVTMSFVVTRNASLG